MSTEAQVARRYFDRELLAVLVVLVAVPALCVVLILAVMPS